MFQNAEDFRTQYRKEFIEELGKEFESANERERYWILAKLIAERARSIRAQCLRQTRDESRKQVYYFSMEFLIGRLLDDYLSNLGIRDLVQGALADMGEDLDALLECECGPGLGNGGLGRLAACFLDSMAHLGISGHGNGIRYRFGLFRQKFLDGYQEELPDNWLAEGYPWEIRKAENAVPVHFGGHVERHYADGEFWFTWDDTEDVLAVPYDVPILGYGGETVNNLRLWSAEPSEERFDMDAFNHGDYAGAVRYRASVEALTCILYPNDNTDAGRALRLKQEYLFVAAGIADIIAKFKLDYGVNAWERLPSLVAIHTNDTHPALAVPELMRVLIDQEKLSWEAAWRITTATISYTNHTIMPEALEKWPIDMMRQLLPRVYMILEEIDHRYLDAFPRTAPNWPEQLRQTAILWDGQARMANLSVIGGHSVNGVAALHTEILQRSVLKEFYELTPEKFSNKTNGVSHRRFLAEANPSLSALISQAIGDGWRGNAAELETLTAFENDAAFLAGLADSKRENKCRLANYAARTLGVAVDPDSIFDVQVKRIHAYKRQLLGVFKIMELYNTLLENPNADIPPSTFVFGGKAAQGYAFAKSVIKLINSVAQVVNNDPRIGARLRVLFVENFNVSNAQLIYPAADISEQISTAGKEASGTGNMKFMFNGAVTLGTLDGANIEILNRVGRENMQIFGLTSGEVDAYCRSGTYLSWDAYKADPRLERVVNQLVDGSFFGADDSLKFFQVYDSLLRNNDEFFVLKDFGDYLAAWRTLAATYQDAPRWRKMSLHNIAMAGDFSSDRTIAQYAGEIWHIKGF
ncbi:MAG: glycogen/starch/alpha-glucan phosphorylase [Oscillospiraceae bacterium]|nr:glycogen/starch/alpha-glucan phosphorylase [Oscillospiraceae bacterium]